MSKYGDLYLCIKTDLSSQGDIYAHYDEVSIEDGDLILKRKDGLITLCISKGHWKCFYAASVFDGSAVCVEHWEDDGISKESKNDEL